MIFTVQWHLISPLAVLHSPTGPCAEDELHVSLLFHRLFRQLLLMEPNRTPVYPVLWARAILLCPVTESLISSQASKIVTQATRDNEVILKIMLFQK